MMPATESEQDQGSAMGVTTKVPTERSLSVPAL